MSTEYKSHIPSQITSNIWLGGMEYFLLDRDQYGYYDRCVDFPTPMLNFFKINKIEKIVCIETRNFLESKKYVGEDNYMKIHLKDEDWFYGDVDNKFVIFDVIEKFIEFMDKGISENKNIYVHCAAGMSRSPTFVIMYLMYKNADYDYEKAGQYVKKCRKIIQPNVHFRTIMKIYELWLKSDRSENIKDFANNVYDDIRDSMCDFIWKTCKSKKCEQKCFMCKDY